MEHSAYRAPVMHSGRVEHQVSRCVDGGERGECSQILVIRRRNWDHLFILLISSASWNIFIQRSTCSVVHAFTFSTACHHIPTRG
jgi:hypothetical protein